ncbi:MAG: alpha-galactosidase [Actinomycetota bacterium]|nr:alpha-galactosidase [Actinomycetota bacterium]
MRRRPELRRLIASLAATLVVASGAAVVGSTVVAEPALALDNGLALTPPMGFNDWNAFGCNVSAALIEQTADAMVANGMRDAGYKYVAMDDCWMAGRTQPRGSAARATAGRDASGTLVPDPTSFPDGIKAVADYVHARGLKLGIYEDVGTTTCQGLAGSYGHETHDAQTFASWGVDYLKYDFCNLPSTTTGEFAGYTTVAMAQVLYGRMRDALAATGAPIVFSMSLALSTGLAQQTWAAPLGNLWRTTSDISDTWSSIVSIFQQNIQYGAYQKPGAWNDPDMLEVGNGGMTDTEYRSHFSLWSIMAAPLIAGTDLRTASAATLAIYNNPDVIAVDQDPLGAEGTTLSSDGTHWTIVKPLANGDKAVLLFNEGSTPAQQSVALSTLGFTGRQSAYQVRDLWSHQTSTAASTLTATVASHGVAMFRITAGKRSEAPSHVSLFGTASPRYVEAGKSTELTATLTNDGGTPLEQVGLTASVPSGWTIKPTQPARKEVKGTAATTATWTLSVPVGTVAGTNSVMITASYKADDETRGSTVTTTVDVIVPPTPPTATSYLSDLDWVTKTGTVYRDQSVPPSSAPGSPGVISVAGTTYSKGLGTQQGSAIEYYLGGRCTSLNAVIGVDDTARTSQGATPSAEFRIIADDSTVFDQTVAKGTAVNVTQAIAGAQVVDLLVVPGSGFGATPADWAGAQVTCTG